MSHKKERVTTDELPNPQEDKRRALREEAVKAVLNGEATAMQRGASTVVKLGGEQAQGVAGKKDAKYVELSRETTDRVFVILAEFGNTRHPSYPDQDTNATIPGPARFDGPLVNEIPEPDRSVDNSTVWKPDYNRAHYEKTYFGEGAGVESLKTYYEKQSSGRYSVDGTVTNWVRVQYNEARYGRSNGFPCTGNVCSNTYNLVQDAANQWYADQLAAGRPAAEVNAELATFDKWDRYDHDTDGNFNEPDGYIDHFQIVHAGGDQADGDPWQGEDAIWSHRWKTFQGTGQGPAGNPDGGNQIGTSGIWIADYTIQPENGGRSVFFHEFGHDLGLPDDYNVLTGGDNNNEHWTLMAQSRLGAKGEQFIGDRAGDLGAWNKLQLGWLDYETLVAGPGVGGNRTMNLGPEEYNNKDPQAVVVVLPKKEVVTELGAPAAGAKQWYSGAGNGLENTMTRNVALPAAAATLTFKARWDIEDCGPATDAVTTPTSRHPPTAARRGRRSRARSPSRPRATGSTARRRRTSRRPSTCRPTPARRSACGSATRPTRQPRATRTRSRTASSSTRSRSRPEPPRCSPTAPRPARTAGPWRVGARWGRRPAACTTTTTSQGTAPTCPTTST